MLGQASGYAATALGYLATAGGNAMLVKEIAEACDIPGPYLAKIVNTLRRVGLVTTQRGVGGGVMLAKRPDEISLLQICECLGDPTTKPRCMMGTAECSDERACPAHKFWTDCRRDHLEFLRNTTIADVAAFETRRRTRALRNDRAAGADRGSLKPLAEVTINPSVLGKSATPGASAGAAPAANNGSSSADDPMGRTHSVRSFSLDGGQYTDLSIRRDRPKDQASDRQA